MTVYQSISETGFVIGRWDPKDEHPQPVDAMCDETFAKSIDLVVFGKANAGGAAAGGSSGSSGASAKSQKKGRGGSGKAGRRTTTHRMSAGGGSGSSGKPSTSRNTWSNLSDDLSRIGNKRIQNFVDNLSTSGEKAGKKASEAVENAAEGAKNLKRLVPKTPQGKAALAALAAGSVVAHANRERIGAAAKKRIGAARDVRHYRPASPYYDRGYGSSGSVTKAAEDILSKAAAASAAKAGAKKASRRVRLKHWYRGTEEVAPTAANPAGVKLRDKYDPAKQMLRPKRGPGGRNTTELIPEAAPKTPQQRVEQAKKNPHVVKLKTNPEYLAGTVSATAAGATAAAKAVKAVSNKRAAKAAERAAAVARAEKDRRLRNAAAISVPAIAATYAVSRAAKPKREESRYVHKSYELLYGEVDIEKWNPFKAWRATRATKKAAKVTERAAAASERRAAAEAAEAEAKRRAAEAAKPKPWAEQNFEEKVNTVSGAANRATDKISELSGKASKISRDVRRSADDFAHAWQGDRRKKVGIIPEMTTQQKVLAGLGVGGGLYAYNRMAGGSPRGYEQQAR